MLILRGGSNAHRLFLPQHLVDQARLIPATADPESAQQGSNLSGSKYT
jgi:hypothetical protein